METAADVAQSVVMLTPLNYDGHAVRIAALYALGDFQATAAALNLLAESIPDFTVNMLFDAPLPASLVPSVAPILDLQDQPRFK